MAGTELRKTNKAITKMLSSVLGIRLQIRTIVQKATKKPDCWGNIDWNIVNREVQRLQIKISEAATNNNKDLITSLQRNLVHSFSGRALAVKNVAQNQGSKTPGIDNIRMGDDKEKYHLILELKNLKDYEAKPVKRIGIPKAKGKVRYLGIPTIKDRCVQAMYTLALTPVAEVTADENSFGFRPGRSQQDAITMAGLATLAKYPGNRRRYVIDADIKGFFDNITHQWILENIPMDKKILESFLKAGYIDLKNRKHCKTKTGVPQGGVISPVIANMVLDGLERKLKEKFKQKGINEKLIVFVRYADDFIVATAQKWMVEIAMKEISEFLKERGLILNKEKTKTVDMDKDPEGFRFLGVQIHRQVRKKEDRRSISDPTVKWEETVQLTVPVKEKVKTFKEKLKEIIKSSQNKSLKEIIKKLNPIIIGWTNYYRHVSAKRDFQEINTYLWKLMLDWSKRKRKNESHKQIRKMYLIKQKEHLTESNFGYINDKGEKVMLFNAGRVNIIYKKTVTRGNYYSSLKKKQ